VVDRLEVLTRPIAPAAAAVALTGLEGLDPRGMTTAADVAAMTRNGKCFMAVSGDSAAVYVLHVRNGVCFVDAAVGEGEVDLVELLDRAISCQAAGLDAIALQTKRRGLVKKLERHGYRVTGWVMRKELK